MSKCLNIPCTFSPLKFSIFKTVSNINIALLDSELSFNQMYKFYEYIDILKH